MKENTNKIKEWLKGMGMVALYLLLPSLLSSSFLFFIKDKKILTLLTYTLCTLFFLFYYQKELIKEWKTFRKNFLAFLKKALLYWLIATIIMIVSNRILSFFSIPLINQEENINLIKEMPLIETIILIILTPIMEEIVFRKSFNKAFNNNSSYLLFTSLLFAFLHIVTSLQNPLALLYLIPFTSLGFAFGFTYKKTNNVFPSIFIHAFHNIITLIDIFLLGGLL